MGSIGGKLMKTKAELTKILEKNYYSVQKQEYQVYDKDEKLVQEFDKLAKAGQLAQKATLKECVVDEKNTKAKYKANNQELKKNYDVKKADLDVLKKNSKNELNVKLEENKNVKAASLTSIKEQIELANKENEDKIASLLRQYETDQEELKKRVVVLKEKLKKDNHSFEQKLEDLKAKHEQVVEGIQENESTKAQKLTEASKHDIEKILEDIEEERERTNRKIENLKAVYEDELAEINENIEDADNEYNDKYENIKSSNEQRIGVREKHLQRALDDKDSRSAKAHKKDIQKIQKEMERDLQLLKKNYDQNHETQLDYRYNFIKDNLEKWAEIERDFITSQENKELEVKILNASLNSRITLANYDFEKQHVEALESYHKQYADTKEKQLSFELETNVNLENEDLESNILDIRFKEENDCFKEYLKEKLETLSKEQKDLDLNKEESDFVAKSELEKVNAKVTFEGVLAKLELENAQVLASEDEKIENHQAEHKRHDAYQKEMLDFENNLKSLFLSRQDEMVAYETLEVNTRHDLKVNYLNTQIKELENDYTKMTAKASEIHELDKVFYVGKIEALSGPMQEELNQFVTEETTKIEEKEAELRSLNPRKNKKQYRALEAEIVDLKKAFDQAKTEKQEVINTKVGDYQTALNHSTERLATSLKQMEDFYTKEVSMLEKALSEEESILAKTLEMLKDRLDSSSTNMEEYQVNVTNRSQMNRHHNDEFLNSQVLIHTSEKDVLKNENESNVGQETDKYNEELASINQKESDTLTDITNRKEQATTNLNEFKQQSQSNVSAIKTEASNKVESGKSQSTAKVDEMTAKAQQDVNEVREELADRLDQHQDHLGVIGKAVSEESTKLEAENRKLTKESEDKIKDAISIVNNKLKEDIQNIN